MAIGSADNFVGQNCYREVTPLEKSAFFALCRPTQLRRRQRRDRLWTPRRQTQTPTRVKATSEIRPPRAVPRRSQVHYRVSPRRAPRCRAAVFRVAVFRSNRAVARRRCRAAAHRQCRAADRRQCRAGVRRRSRVLVRRLNRAGLRRRALLPRRHLVVVPREAADHPHPAEVLPLRRAAGSRSGFDSSMSNTTLLRARTIS